MEAPSTHALAKRHKLGTAAHIPIIHRGHAFGAKQATTRGSAGAAMNVTSHRGGKLFAKRTHSIFDSFTHALVPGVNEEFLVPMKTMIP